jgi:hypothetical protein
MDCGSVGDTVAAFTFAGNGDALPGAGLTVDASGAAGRRYVFATPATGLTLANTDFFIV